jgi:type III restriction enzyme
LNACDALNLNLIKGIAKEHFEPLSYKEDKVRIATIKSRTSVTFHYLQRGQNTKVIVLQKNDPISLIAQSLDGIHITAIGTNYIELSNGQRKNEREEFGTDIYSSSYSEQMIRLALE